MSRILATVRDGLRPPPRGRSWAWLFALGIGLVLAIQPIWGDRTAIGVAGAIALTLVAASRWQLRWLPVVVLVLCGFALRLSVAGHESSDVSDVTRVALTAVRFGGDPYGFGYVVSRPVGAPFPYGPVALLWYLPMYWDPSYIEFLVSGALLAFLGYRAANGRPLGLAIFALSPPLVLAAMDGSNDTSAGLLILAALVAAGRRPIVGAGLLAVAVAFKPYAIAWLPPLVLWAGLPALAAFAAVSVIAWSPVLFVWGPGSYLKSLAMAQQTHLRSAYWSLGSIIAPFAPEAAARALETLRYFAAGAVAFFAGRRVRSIDGVIVVGTLAFLIAQFGGYFGSYVYLAALAPILCWRVDDWVRRALPEVMHAYSEMPGLTHRVRRPATMAASTRPSVAAPRRPHAGATQRVGSGRPTRNPAG